MANQRKKWEIDESPLLEVDDDGNVSIPTPSPTIIEEPNELILPNNRLQQGMKNTLSVGKSVGRFFVQSIGKLIPKNVFTIWVPMPTLYRTELLCRFISQKSGEAFYLEDFLNFLVERIVQINYHGFQLDYWKEMFTLNTLTYLQKQPTKERVTNETQAISVTLDKETFHSLYLIHQEIESYGVNLPPIDICFLHYWINTIFEYINGEDEFVHTMISALQKGFSAYE